MDFLKTLMLYMALTTAVGVQGAEPATQVTPEPTAIVAEATFAPTETPAPTAEPTFTPAPKNSLPAPTVAPSKKYSLLTKGKKGEDVRKLQLRLKDLGFLKGNIDGSYGNGTRSAVLAFQKANGLEADGDAGRATLTLLYENPYLINASGELITVGADGSIATAVPTETPAPALEGLAAPAVAAPTPVPLTLTPIDGAAVVYNDAGEAISALKQEDGVTVRMQPRVFDVSNGTTAVSLSDLCYAIDGWELTQDGNTVTFSAEGYPFTFLPEGESYICEMEEEGFPCEPGDLIVDANGVSVRTEFLGELLNGTSLWEPEEKTLLLRFAGREVDEATD